MGQEGGTNSVLTTIDDIVDGIDTKVDTVDLGIDAIKVKTDTISSFEHETEHVSTAVAEQVASAAATSLTAGLITPMFPSGATLVRALLVASIHAANQTAATHNISLKVQGKKGAGEYADQLDLTAQTSLALVNVAGAGDGLTVPIDVTTLVDASGAAYSFKIIVNSDNAGAVNYTSSFVLVLVYKI